jgi:hypothetical protein
MHRRQIAWLPYSLVLITALTAACRPYGHQPADIAPPLLAYLDTAIATIRENALMSDSVDWAVVSTEARTRATGLDSIPELYPIVRFLLAQLRDGHSFLQLSDTLRQDELKTTGAAPQDDLPVAMAVHKPSPYGERMRPEGELLLRGGNTFAFVFMPQGRRDNRFATSFQQSIAELAQESPCGWIVDLRGNGGGDMWPMLAGLGPLLGEGDLGRFVMPENQEEYWAYRAGSAIHRRDQAEEILARVEGAPMPVLTPLPPVAVLIDRGTASSGEAIAISFRSRVRTRLFGEHSYGASTATRGFQLPDGANLVIAVSTFGDLNGHVYSHGLAPDELFAIGDQMVEKSADPAVNAAVEWLGRQSACMSTFVRCPVPVRWLGVSAVDPAAGLSGFGAPGLSISPVVVRLAPAQAIEPLASPSCVALLEVREALERELGETRRRWSTRSAAPSPASTRRSAVSC